MTYERFFNKDYSSQWEEGAELVTSEQRVNTRGGRPPRVSQVLLLWVFRLFVWCFFFLEIPCLKAFYHTDMQTNIWHTEKHSPFPACFYGTNIRS